MSSLLLPPGVDVPVVEPVAAGGDLPDDLHDVSAVIVTRGDVDLVPVYHSLSMMGEIVTWNNGTLEIEIANMDGVRRLPAQIGWDADAAPRDLAVYGRYAAMRHCRFQTVYVQDDDCLLPPESIEALIAALGASDRRSVVCNLPEPFRAHYTDSALVGFGAIMDVDLPEKIFSSFLEQIGDRELDLDAFLRRCDNVLTTLAQLIVVDVPYVDRPFANDPGRMWKTTGHVGERDAMIALARTIREELAQARAA